MHYKWHPSWLLLNRAGGSDVSLLLPLYLLSIAFTVCWIFLWLLRLRRRRLKNMDFL